MTRDRFPVSEDIEIKLVDMNKEGARLIKEGWRQANVEEAEAHKEVILALMTKWAIVELDGGWISGRGFGGKIGNESRELELGIIMRRRRSPSFVLRQGFPSLNYDIQAFQTIQSEHLM